jgi:hypothetical protein
MSTTKTFTNATAAPVVKVDASPVTLHVSIGEQPRLKTVVAGRSAYGASVAKAVARLASEQARCDSLRQAQFIAHCRIDSPCTPATWPVAALEEKRSSCRP